MMFDFIPSRKRHFARKVQEFNTLTDTTRSFQVEVERRRQFIISEILSGRDSTGCERDDFVFVTSKYGDDTVAMQRAYVDLERTISTHAECLIFTGQRANCPHNNYLRSIFRFCLARVRCGDIRYSPSYGKVLIPVEGNWLERRQIFELKTGRVMMSDALIRDPWIHVGQYMPTHVPAPKAIRDIREDSFFVSVNTRFDYVLQPWEQDQIIHTLMIDSKFPQESIAVWLRMLNGCGALSRARK